MKKIKEYKPSNNDREFRLDNGVVVRLKGADDPQSETLQSIFVSIQRCIPRWIESICVRIRTQESEGNEAAQATCYPNKAYRRIMIDIFPLFWEGETKELRQRMIHEIAHTYTVDVISLLRNYSAAAFPDGGVGHDLVEVLLREAVEGVTCDTAYALNRLIEESE